MGNTSTMDPYDACGEPTTDALARTVRLSVDRATIDTQQLCPACFADWIARYQSEMGGESPADADRTESEIIID